MRMRRRISENFSALLIPAVCCAVTFYFGYAGIFGRRGLLAWNATQAQLETAKADLATLKSERVALQHRITLLDDKAIDPDLLEEVARGVLSQGSADEVAVPREKH